MAMVLQLAVFLVSMVLFAASQRAMLRPGESGFAFVRIGMDELRLIGLAIAVGIFFYAGLMIAMIGVAFIGAVGVMISPALGIAVGIIGFLAAVGLLLWLVVRLSLIYSLTFLRRRFVVGESWRLTKGRFWTLFGGYFVIFLLLAAVGLAATWLSAGPYLQEVMGAGFDRDNLETAAQAQAVRQFSLEPRTVAGWLLSCLSGALWIALGGGAAATATIALAGTAEEELARTFD